MSQIKSFTINLDDVPSARWDHVIVACQPELSYFNSNLESILATQFSPLFAKLWKRLHYLIRIARIPKEYMEEINSIAQKSGLHKDTVLLLNVALDYLSRCTSAVVSCKEGLYHFRTLDWELPDIHKLLIGVEFTKGDQVLYKGYTFVGMVGILTGMRPGAFALSFNFRKTLKWKIPSISNFSGMIFRKTLETQQNFTEACMHLQKVRMNASGYLILSGIQSHEGVVIIKGPDPRIIVMEAKCLVQTNHDPGITWVDPVWAGDDVNLLTTLDRQKCVIDYVEAHSEPSEAEVKGVMKLEPIRNKDTVFTCMMSSKGGVLELVL